MPALAGANLIYGLGMLESGVTMDYGQLVMDNEFARMIKFVVAGIPVTDETLAVEDIAAVGSFGDFLSAGLNLQAHARAEQPKLHRPPGARGLGGRRLARPLRPRPGRGPRILETHQPEPLPDDVPPSCARSSSKPSASSAWDRPERREREGDDSGHVRRRILHAHRPNISHNASLVQNEIHHSDTNSPACAVA